MFYASVTKPAAVGVAAVVAVAVLLVDPPEGIAKPGEAEPRIDATVVAATEGETTGGPVQLSSPRKESETKGESTPRKMMTVQEFLAQERSDTPSNDEPGAQDPGASPAESASATQEESSDDPVAKALEAFAKKAREEKDRDLSQPSFEELYWQYEHWKAELKGYDTAVEYIESLIAADRIRLEQYKALHEDGSVSITELQAVEKELLSDEASLPRAEAELPLARAKVAEFERLLKQAALRETGAKIAAKEASPQPDPNRWLTQWLEFQARKQETASDLPPVKELELQLKYWGKKAMAAAADVGSARAVLTRGGELDDSTKQDLKRQILSAEADIAQAQAKREELKRLIEQAKNQGRAKLDRRRTLAKDLPPRPDAPPPASFVSPPPNPYQPSPAPTPAWLKPGDVVLLDTTLVGPDRRRLKDHAVVEADGSLPLGPLLGRVEVSGLSLREAEALVQKRFAQFWKEEKVQLIKAASSPPIPLLPLPSRPPSTTSRSEPIQAGEAISYTIEGPTIYTGACLVNSEGNVSVPSSVNGERLSAEGPKGALLVGVAGLSIEEAESQVAKALQERNGGEEIDVRMQRIQAAPLRDSIKQPELLEPPRIYPGVDDPKPAFRY